MRLVAMVVFACTTPADSGDRSATGGLPEHYSDACTADADCGDLVCVTRDETVDPGRSGQCQLPCDDDRDCQDLPGCMGCNDDPQGASICVTLFCS